MRVSSITLRGLGSDRERIRNYCLSALPFATRVGQEISPLGRRGSSSEELRLVNMANVSRISRRICTYPSSSSILTFVLTWRALHHMPSQSLAVILRLRWKTSSRRGQNSPKWDMKA